MADFVLVTTTDGMQVALTVANIITCDPMGTDPEIDVGTNVLMREGRQLVVRETLNEITGLTLLTQAEIADKQKEREAKNQEVLDARKAAEEEAKAAAEEEAA